MKPFRVIGLLSIVLATAACRPSARDVVPAERPCRALEAVDSMMWERPDSAFALLLAFAASPAVDSLDAFNGHYCQLLISELLYKKDYAQSNREGLLRAVDYLDSVGDPFLDARAHYIKGVGFYEQGEAVPACEEYLKALEMMEERFEENSLTGKKAKFVFFTYNRLLELFSEQFMMGPAIACGEQALVYCHKDSLLFKEIPNTYFHIGKQYDKMGEKEVASRYYGRALEGMSASSGPIYRDAVSMKALCEYQMGSGIENSLNTIKGILSEAEGEAERASRLIAIGAIFMREGDYDSALVYYEPVFLNEADVVLRIRVAERLRIVYDSLGDSEKSDECIRFLADHKKPEGENKALVSKLEDLFKGYLDQKQAKQFEAERKRSIRKTTAIIVPITIFVAVAIMLIAKYRRTKMREEHEVLRQDLQQRKEQVDALRKTICQQRELKDRGCEMFLNEAICQRILKLVQGKRITARDNSFQHGIVLREEDCRLLMEAVERHYKGFDGGLLGRCADLKRRDLTLCHLYLLKLDESTIAALMGRTYSAIKKQNENLQRKLGIEISIAAYVMALAEELCIVHSDPTSVLQGVLQKVPQDYSQIILEIVSNNPQITREEIANQLNISTKTVGRYLKKLTGRIRYVGSGYSGHWEVVG